MSSAHLKIKSVLLQMLLHAGAQLQNPAPLRLHGSSVSLQERQQGTALTNLSKSLNIKLLQPHPVSVVMLGANKGTYFNSGSGWVVLYQALCFLLHRLNHLLLFIQLHRQFLLERHAANTEPGDQKQQVLHRRWQSSTANSQRGTPVSSRCRCCGRSSRRPPPPPPSHSAR